MVTNFNPLARPAALDTGRAPALDSSGTNTSKPAQDWFAPTDLNSSEPIDAAALQGSVADPGVVAARVLSYLGS